MKRVVIVHGYKGKPNTNWKPWLKTELQAEGYTVDVPEMPNTDHPVAEEWHQTLVNTIGNPDVELYLIGHSLGCITILRYLETLASNQKVGGVILVAGFGERFPKYTSGSHDSFFDHPLDWQEIRKHSDNFVAIHSSDDPAIGLGQLELFKVNLGAKAVAVQGFGHFGSADNVYEIPIVKDELYAIDDHL